MANKKFWLGMLVMVLVFGMTVVGCEDLTDNTINYGYTFEFILHNDTKSWYGDEQKIIKIEFINGDNGGATVLQTEMVNIPVTESSTLYKISGFTEKGFSGSDDERVFGVRVTYADGTIVDGFNKGVDKRKISVNCKYDVTYMYFYTFW